MKRLHALLLCGVLLAASACATAKESAPQEEGYRLYFREADLENAPGGNALRAEYIEIENAAEKTGGELAELLLQKLLEGPKDETLVNPIPRGTSLLGVQVSGGRAEVDLSIPYNLLSGVELTLADYAVTMTLSQLPDVLTTVITVHGQTLAYRDRQTFGAWDVLHATEEDVVSTLTTQLFFCDENGDLVPDIQALDLYEGDTQAKTVVNALEKGPENEVLFPVLPDNWEDLSVWVKETTCYVNLPTAWLTEETGEAQVALALEALGRSLCQLDTVEDVRFLVDGAFAPRYGAVDVSAAYTA